MKQSPDILVVGCGDIGKRVAKELIQQDCTVWAISHSAESANALGHQGIKVISADLDDSASLANIHQQFDYIFYFAPPPASGITDTRISHFLTSFLQNHSCKRLLYISTTGVYGNHNEEWIDESTPVSPDNDRSQRRLDAEQQVEKFANQFGMEYVIIRVAGIYSLEKLPLKQLESHKQILDRKLSSASNRIHADDLCQICITAMFNAKSGEIFNAADGNPSTMSDYFIKVAEVFDLPMPEEVDWEYAETHFSPGMLSYLKESKKISNEKIRTVLGIDLKYPSLDDGLKQCKELYGSSFGI